MCLHFLIHISLCAGLWVTQNSNSLLLLATEYSVILLPVDILNFSSFVFLWFLNFLDSFDLMTYLPTFLCFISLTTLNLFFLLFIFLHFSEYIYFNFIIVAKLSFL